MARRQIRSMASSLAAVVTMAIGVTLLGRWRPNGKAMWFIRVPKEEAMMHLQFGKAWEAYCVRAGRLLPRWTA